MVPGGSLIRLRPSQALLLVLLLLLLGGVGRAEAPPSATPPAPTTVPLAHPEHSGSPSAPAAVPSTHPEHSGASPAPMPSPSPSALAFDLPPLVIPDWGENWWEEPFLFEMASSGKMTGEQRARRVLERVRDMVDQALLEDSGYRLADLEVDQSAGMTVVRCGPEVLVTVLPDDIPEYYLRLPPERLKQVEHQIADRWAGLLEREIRNRIAARRPELRWLGAAVAAGMLVGVILVNSFLSWFARRYLATPLWSLRATVWVLWLVVLLAVVPELENASRLLMNTVLEPLWLVVTAGLGSAVILQVGRVFVHRYLRSLSHHRGSSQRAEQRAASLEGAAVFGMRLALLVASVFYIVTNMGIDASKMLAGAGLFGAAITLVSQDLIRDLIAGFNILLEDQFVVGDWIEAGATSGTVEAFHLRATRVRASDGTACVVPNSDLRTVKNHSLEWSQVDYQVAVALGADAAKALELLVEEAGQLTEQRPEQVLGVPEVLGLERVSRDGIVLRVLVKTRPLQQWSFKRELNRRVLARFQAEGIELAGATQDVRIEAPLAGKVS